MVFIRIRHGPVTDPLRTRPGRDPDPPRTRLGPAPDPLRTRSGSAPDPPVLPGHHRGENRLVTLDHRTNLAGRNR